MQSKTGGYSVIKIGRKIGCYIQGLRGEAPGTIGGVVIKVDGESIRLRINCSGVRIYLGTPFQNMIPTLFFWERQSKEYCSGFICQNFKYKKSGVTGL
jgi:hypothetical protein